MSEQSTQSIQICFTANWNVRLIINLNFPSTCSSYVFTTHTFQYSQTKQKAVHGLLNITHHWFIVFNNTKHYYYTLSDEQID